MVKSHILFSPKNSTVFSIVIPVKNGEPWIAACIESIIKQTRFNQTEIIVVDSGSTDNTLKILSGLPVKIYQIPGASFNHGGTRNFAVSKCTGEFVVMTVQDARAADERWLEKLHEPFDDPDVVAVSGAQAVPHETDKNPVEWFRPQSRATIQKFRFGKEGFLRLSAIEQSRICGWDNVNSMYRRDILLKFPFDEVVFGEDMLWAKNAFLADLTLAYNKAAVVYHYHQENETFLFRRLLTSWYFRYKHFKVIPQVPNVTFRKHMTMLKTILFRSPGLTLKQKLFWWRYNQMRIEVKKQTYEQFSNALNNSDAALEKLHNTHCGVSPQHVYSEALS